MHLLATENLSIFDPASPQAESIRSLTVLVFAITGFIFLVVEGILFYSLFRFRSRSTTDTAEPPQVYGSKPIEIAWTAAPALVVFVLVLVVARTLWEVNVPPPEPRPGDHTLFVTAIGHQWWWEYTYDHYDGEPLFAQGTDGQKLKVTTANELHIPAGADGAARPVYLTLKSADVCHSYWIPRLGGKTDMIPGRVNAMSFQAQTPQAQTPVLYVGQCAEYCGTQHAHMLLRVIVDSPDDFDNWLKNERGPALKPKGDVSVSEEKDFFSLSCVKCHTVRGTPADGKGAPDLTHLMRRQTLASGTIPNNPDGQDLRRWIGGPQKESGGDRIYPGPQKIKPGCLMPDFGLSERELDRVVDYLRTLR